MTFYNRDTERKSIEDFFEINSNNKFSKIICIEGDIGTGKTEFLKYIIDKYISNPLIINEKSYYKCEKIYSESDFSFVAEIVYDIYTNRKKFFEKQMEKYFLKHNFTSLLEAVCMLMPEVKMFSFSKSLLEKKAEQLTEYKSNITDKLLHKQLVNFFADLILSYISCELSTNEITICIDDFQWLDVSSRRTLEQILYKSKCNNLSVISIIATIRSKRLLDLNEKEKYNIFLELYNEYFQCQYHIRLSDFGELTTYNILKDSNNSFLVENRQKIYHITKGNPQEIFQTLTLDCNSLERLIHDSYELSNSYENESHIITTQSIMDIYCQNSIYGLIINVLSVINCKVSSALLFEIIYKINTETSGATMTEMDYKRCCNELSNKKIIILNESHLEITNSSIKNTICNYLRQTFEYEYYVDVIVNVLSSDKNRISNTSNSNLYLCIKLYSDIIPLQSFKLFAKNINIIPFITPDLCEIISKCFCQVFLNISVKLQEEIVVDRLLPTLLNNSKLNTGYLVCNCLHSFYKSYSTQKQIDYLTYYTKILIDRGDLKPARDNICAIKTLNELFEINITDNNTIINNLLLGMSVYEHVLDFDKIKSLYMQAKIIVDRNEDVSPYTLSRFYRNKGLFISHKDLIIDYRDAIHFSKKITDNLLRKLMLGTSHNNLGLAYFYSSKIKLALNEFNLALNNLKEVGNNLSRLYNNIALCHFILGDLDDANKNMSMALNWEKEGDFTNICMKTNYSIILNAIGNSEKAIGILDEIVDDYYSNNFKCSDLVPYSAALLNRAYVHICNKEYLLAYKLIKESKNQKYRFEKDLQELKRQNLMNFCLLEENIINFYSNDYLDWEETTCDVYKKPYSLLPLAFYVI